MILQFGTKVFSVSRNKIYTFDGFTYSTKLSTSTQDAVGKKPSTNIKGVDLNKIKLTTFLSSSLGVNPRNELESWEKILGEAVAYPLVLGGKALGLNKYLLNDCSLSKVEINKNGNITSAELSLSFEEFVAPGVSKETKVAGANTTKTPGIAANDAYKVAEYSSNEKNSMKRDISKFTTARRGLISK